MGWPIRGKNKYDIESTDQSEVRIMVTSIRPTNQATNTMVYTFRLPIKYDVYDWTVWPIATETTASLGDDIEIDRSEAKITIKFEGVTKYINN